MTRFTSYIGNVRIALEERLIPVEGGPLDGIRVITEGNLAEALAAVEMPPIDEHAADLATPATVYLSALCHICGQRAIVDIGLESKTLVDDKRRVLSAKVDAGSVVHICGQMTLPTGDGDQTAFDWTIDRTGLVSPERLAEMLGEVGFSVDVSVIEGWDEPQRSTAMEFALATHLASDETTEPEVPGFILDVMSDVVPPCPYPGCILNAEHDGDHALTEDEQPPKRPRRRKATQADDDLLPE